MWPPTSKSLQETNLLWSTCQIQQFRLYTTEAKPSEVRCLQGEENMLGRNPINSHSRCQKQKGLFTILPVRRNPVSRILSQHLGRAISNTFNFTVLLCIFHGASLVQIQNEDRLPMLTSSTVIYSLRCFCDASYIGQMARRQAG